MAKILITAPDGPYSAEMDTGVMPVTMTENFVGVTFLARDGEALSVVMRDSGYEIYYADSLASSRKIFIEAKNGTVKV